MTTEITEYSKTDAAFAVNETAALMQVIARAASDPNVDVDKMERLLQMQERVRDRAAEQEFAEAMSRTQAAMPPVIKDKQNAQTNSQYASLESIAKIVTPIYTGHGFSLSFNTDASPVENCVRITCDVLHKGGHSKRFMYDSPLDSTGAKGQVNKTPTHARGSSISYGQRYLTKLIFNLRIAGEDDDGNAASMSSVFLDWKSEIESAENIERIEQLGKELATSGVTGRDRDALRKLYQQRKSSLKAA